MPSGPLPPFPIPGLGNAYNFIVGALLVDLWSAKNRRNERVALQAGLLVGKSFLSILGSPFKLSGSLLPFPITGLGKAYKFAVGALLVDLRGYMLDFSGGVLIRSQLKDHVRNGGNSD